MDPAQVYEELRLHPPDGLGTGEVGVREIQANVFQVKSGGHLFLVKWIAANNQNGQNELRIGRLFARFPVVPAPRLVFETLTRDGTLGGWEWIDGHDLREQGREFLLDAFTRLGELHRMLRNDGEVQVPPRGERYPCLAELLAGEAYRLTAPFDSKTRSRCTEILGRLQVGYPTLIHGDMHPGNVLTNDRRVWLVDWSFACNSLNLFDLDYIYSTALPPSGPAWSQITPMEAVLALPAYFQAAGLDHIHYFETHHAVMVWNVLRSYENGVINGYRAELAGIREQLQTLLDEKEG